MFGTGKYKYHKLATVTDWDDKLVQNPLNVFPKPRLIVIMITVDKDKIGRNLLKLGIQQCYFSSCWCWM